MKHFKRNHDIAKRFLVGETYVSIGRLHGVSAESVRMIAFHTCKRCDPELTLLVAKDYSKFIVSDLRLHADSFLESIENEYRKALIPDDLPPPSYPQKLGCADQFHPVRMDY
jgi:hypothetical protein